MAEAKAFVPYQAPESQVQQQHSYVQPPAAVPPPKMMGRGRDLLCSGCEDPIEPGSDHIVLTSCVAVPSKKDPSAVVSENHQESKDIAFHDERCLFDYLTDQSVMNGDGMVDDLVEQYFGGASVVACRCANCGLDVDADGLEILCDHCESKMR